MEKDKINPITQAKLDLAKFTSELMNKQGVSFDDLIYLMTDRLFELQSINYKHIRQKKQ